MKKLERPFYEGETLEVAKELLGKYMVHETKDGRTVGKIVEVEAYIGPDDPACHAYQGKCTSRTQIMFGQGGHAYVYLIYGVYYCMNIVTNQESFPEAILIRGLEPIDGLALMKQRRKTEKLLQLCSGPGKLCAAMGITKLQNGLDLEGEELYLLEGERISPESPGRCGLPCRPRCRCPQPAGRRKGPHRFAG